jgi:hypothetical protein
MPANSVIQVSSLNFDDIKSSLKSYISSKQVFADYDFEGSTISLLLDLLAYNTYQNAYYTSMVGNEMFLDSAALRESVVSRAKMLGYTPRSAQGASTNLNVVITANGSPDSITIAKNTEFNASVDGQTFKFVTPQAYVIENSSGNYSSNTITITEGRPQTFRYTVSSSNPSKYIIPNRNADTGSITVQVQTSSVDTTTEAFTLANDILEVNANSAVYFLQEIADSEYEIYFGDGVIGKQLQNGNIVIINYRICNGTDGNGIQTFTNPATLGGYSTFTAVATSRTSGGANSESIESIKFNAPKSFAIQNRTVVAEDYKRKILSDFGDIQSLRVWGGEENVPPVYGKVFISAKPTTGSLLSQQEKDEIKSSLRKYNVVSIDVEFVDPTYLYILPTITVNYNSKLTTLSANEVRAKVVAKIRNFETSKLGTFDNDKFRFSSFVKTIDSADVSIQNNTTTIKLQKRFSPNFSTSTKYTIDFSNALQDITAGFVSLSGIPTNHPGGGIALSSTAFTCQGSTCYLDDDGFGNVRLYTLSASNTKTFLSRTQGTINYKTGVVILNSFNPTAAANDEISISVVPASPDVVSLRYQLMLLGLAIIRMKDEATGSVSSAATVSTTGSVTQINETAIGTLV